MPPHPHSHTYHTHTSFPQAAGRALSSGSSQPGRAASQFPTGCRQHLLSKSPFCKTHSFTLLVQCCLEDKLFCSGLLTAHLLPGSSLVALTLESVFFQPDPCLCWKTKLNSSKQSDGEALACPPGKWALSGAEFRGGIWLWTLSPVHGKHELSQFQQWGR